MPDDVMRDPYAVPDSTPVGSAFTDGNPLGTPIGTAPSTGTTRDTPMKITLPPHLQEKVDACRSSARYAAFGGGLVTFASYMAYCNLKKRPHGMLASFVITGFGYFGSLGLSMGNCFNKSGIMPELKQFAMDEQKRMKMASEHGISEEAPKIEKHDLPSNDFTPIYPTESPKDGDQPRELQPMSYEKLRQFNETFDKK